MARCVQTTLWISLLISVTAAFGQEAVRPRSKAAAKPSADASAIRANVSAFVKAYNAGDAKAVANLFSPEAQIIDEDGETTQGRDAIQRSGTALVLEYNNGGTMVARGDAQGNDHFSFKMVGGPPNDSGLTFGK